MGKIVRSNQKTKENWWMERKKWVILLVTKLKKGLDEVIYGVEPFRILLQGLYSTYIVVNYELTHRISNNERFIQT